MKGGTAVVVSKYQAASEVCRNIDLARVRSGPLTFCRKTERPVKCVETSIRQVLDGGRCSDWLRRVPVRRADHPAVTHTDRIGATRPEAAHVSVAETPARCCAGTTGGPVKIPLLWTADQAATHDAKNGRSGRRI